MEIRKCKKCGFILGTRPGLKEIDGVCLSCINIENKKNIDFKKRQEWLTKYIQDNKGDCKYDCAVAVSSHTIVRRLIESHGVKNPLLISVTDEFTHTKAGLHNINNLVKKYNLDLVTFRCQPNTFVKETKKDFFESLHPLKWIEERIYDLPPQIAKGHGINLLFYGENSAYEYGTSEELEIFHPETNDDLKIIFMGAIHPYSISDSLKMAREIGFMDLDDFREWPRAGGIENYTQIDSVGYIVQLWTKFVKFGFQRVSDIACRFVREGKITKEQAELLIKDKDYILDRASKMDFCDTIGITEEEFDKTVDKFANHDLVTKDVNDQWRRKDLI